ncbi:MAG: hypothetical protein IVW54_14995 [Candidatus Binataceae bacterium]|nr:hypothetical protein [Candidatus Binataceae bacterium]
MTSAIAAGILLGFAVSTIAYRFQLLRVPAAGIVQRMDRDLDLTPAQRNEIAEELDRTRSQIGLLRTQFQARRRAALAHAFEDIRAALTPQQQQKFDRIYNPNRVGLARQQ